MASNIKKNQTLTEFVSEEQFNETIKTILNNRQDKEKPLWTCERIEEAITAVEQFQLKKAIEKRTHKQYYYGKKYDVMEVGTNKSLILKRKSDSDPVVTIVPTENFYHILRETHQSTGHGGRDKMLYSLKSKYLIPTSVVLEFLKLCTVCQSKKKNPRKRIVVCPIVSRDFNHRGQIDLVDLQSTPNKNYKWILHYQDHATKFSFLRPLTSKKAAEVAIELLKIFLEVGCPHILQSDSGPEFTATIIQELISMWPTCKIVNDTPRHPASQGSVDRSNQDVEAMLRAWLIDNDTKNWAIGCYFVQFQKNSSFHRTIKRSPYKALFGTEPKTGLQSSHISKELLEELVTDKDLDLLLNQQAHSIFSTLEDLPEASLENNFYASNSEDPCQKEECIKDQKEDAAKQLKISELRNQSEDYESDSNGESSDDSSVENHIDLNKGSKRLLRSSDSPQSVNKRIRLENTPSTSGINTSVIKTETQDTSDPLNPNYQDPLNRPSIEGNRIVTPKYYFQQLQKLAAHNPVKRCSFTDLQIVSEDRNGLHSQLIVHCENCSQGFKVPLTDSSVEKNLDLNKSIVDGKLGYESLKAIFDSIDVPGITAEKYQELVDKNTREMNAREIYIKEEPDFCIKEDSEDY